jgi:hypothetical protein
MFVGFESLYLSNEENACYETGRSLLWPYEIGISIRH